jgi:hypothetical protein
LSPRFSAHSAPPTSVDGSNHSVLLANGTVVKRNTVRKDNALTSFDFRVAKRWRLNERFRLEGAVDTFNLFNSKNLKQRQNGNLLFNFDGTLTSGLGDPRQAQLGVKQLRSISSLLLFVLAVRSVRRRRRGWSLGSALAGPKSKGRTRRSVRHLHCAADL